MREYKFRGKPFEDVDFDEINVHISKDDFVYGNLIVDGKVAYIVNGIVEVTEEYLQLEQWIPIRPETVGQCTGLHDKNGKDIYEGDKLKVVNHSILIGDGTSNMSCETRVYEIVFHEHEFVGKLIEYGIPHLKIVENYDPIYHDLIGMMDDIEIIGNIHDKGEVK